mgnify:CR=1 FL=1
MESKCRHLEMTVRIIERMEKNSFLIKGWAMTLVVAITALFANDSEKKFILVIFIPIVVFWFLDAFYLQIEKKYRILYQAICQKKSKEIDFSMDINSLAFDEKDRKEVCFTRCLFSFSEMIFYLPLIISEMIFICYLKII